MCLLQGGGELGLIIHNIKQLFEKCKYLKSKGLFII